MGTGRAGGGAVAGVDVERLCPEALRGAVDARQVAEVELGTGEVDAGGVRDRLGRLLGRAIRDVLPKDVSRRL